jgi:uncharacterized protein (DUF952 family)
MTSIYHITTRDALAKARESGEYRSESFSDDGFIHFSGPHQLLGVAEKFYAGQHGLVLLVVEVSLLKAELKYELPLHPGVSSFAPPSDEMFPHLYGPLNFDAIVAVHDFEPDPSGRFSLPAALRVSN